MRGMDANAAAKRDRAGRLEEQGDFELGRRSIPGSLGQIALIAVFGFFTDFHRTHPWLLLGLASLIVAFNLLRFCLCFWQARFYPDRRRLWVALFAPCILGPALCWGVLFFFAIRTRGLTHYTTTVALLIDSGLSASLITTVSPNRKLSFLFITLVIGIPLIALAMHMDPQAVGLALIFIAYYVFLSLQLNIHHRSFWEGIRNRERLVGQRNRLQTVVDAIPGLVAWIGTDLKFRGVNRNYALNYVGMTEEFLGRDLTYKNRDSEFIEAVRGFVASPSRDHAALEIRISVGEMRRWHLLVIRRSSNFAEDVASEEIYIICIDIHELKQAQAALEQQRIHTELTSKLAALGELAANLAHEIRNPLSVIIASVELVKKEISASSIDRAKIRSLSDRVLATSARINKIIDNLRSFSRKTEGEPYSIVSLGQVVRESLDLVQDHFRASRVPLLADRIDESMLIRCRPVEISQVLVNLLNNALDAAKGQDQKWVRLQGSAEESEIAIVVTDSGRGIPEPVAEQIFSPFFTTKSKDMGTGLGLSISRQIIERHGGTLVLDRSARNTTFVARLPAVAAIKKRA